MDGYRFTYGGAPLSLQSGRNADECTEAMAALVRQESQQFRDFATVSLHIGMLIRLVACINNDLPSRPAKLQAAENFNRAMLNAQLWLRIEPKEDD